MSWGEPPERLEAGPRHRRRGAWLLVALAVVAGVLFVATGSPAPTSLPPPDRLPGPAAGPTSTPSPVVLGRPVIDGLSGTLWARSADAVYAVDLATGRTTTTPIERLQSTGPVSFVTAGDGVLVRPLDNVPGWLVRPGAGAQPLPGKFPLAHRAFPAPSGQVWIDVDDGTDSVIMVDAAGRPTGSTVASSGTYVADGAGGLLLTDAGGVWAIADGSLSRLSTGTLTGTGAHHLRFTECDARHRCHQVLLDRRSGKRTVVEPDTADQTDGQLSPDGRWQAQITDAHPGTAVTISPVAGRGDPHQYVSFASDLQDVQPGLWLDNGWYVLPTDGHLTFYQPATEREVVPELPLTGVIQLAHSP